MRIGKPSSSSDNLSEDHARGIYTKLRTRIEGWLENKQIDPLVRQRLLLLPDLFMLLIRLTKDRRVSKTHKLEFATAITYVVSPFDLIPDMIPPMGLMDDVLAMALALTYFLSITGKTGEHIVREHWEGDEDILRTIRDVVTKGNAFRGRLSMLDKLLKRIGKLKHS